MSEQIWLVLRGVPAYLWALPLTDDCQVAGRSSECEIHVAHDTVSRQHAALWQAGGDAHVRDMESSNGTFVNGTRIAKSPLGIGDCLQLGEVQLDVVPEVAVKESTAVFEARPTAVVSSDSNSQMDSAIAELSAAQVRVLRLLLQGYSEKKVAAELYLSPHTVHTHVKHIYRQLDVRSRAQLMARFLPPPTDESAG